MRVSLIVGTLKGAFVLRSDGERRSWSVEGPLFKGWQATAAARDPLGRSFLALASDIYGPSLQVSEDLESWRPIEKGPAFPPGGPRRLRSIWKIRAEGPVYYAGVQEAALFRSDDAGKTWELVRGLEELPSRSAWQPGAGGLCAHSLLVDPRDESRLWCGISAVGVFRSEDGGKSWASKNAGVPYVLEDETHKEIGFCVHALAQDPDAPDAIYRQDHRGMFRTRDGGDSWQRIETGLPSGFGFPLVMDRRTKALYAIPQESDEFRVPPGGKLRVYRSRNGGDSWEPLTRGLPQENAWAGVLRGAAAVDSLDPCGVYFGTTSGTLHASRDGGESWERLPCLLPRVCFVSAFAEE